MEGKKCRLFTDIVDPKAMSVMNQRKKGDYNIFELMLKVFSLFSMLISFCLRLILHFQLTCTFEAHKAQNELIPKYNFNLFKMFLKILHCMPWDKLARDE